MRCLLLIAALAATAYADEPADAGIDAPAADTAPDAAAEQPAPPDPRDDAAWQRYHQAFSALARGDRALARAQLEALRRDYPDHRATVLAAGALEPSGAPGNAITAQASTEEPVNGARAELALFQSLHGIAAATELCILLGCKDGALVVGLDLVGGAVGAVVALSISDVTPGKRGAINSGTFWGAQNSLMLVLSQANPDSSGVAGQLLLGQITGTLIGSAIAKYQPTAGQVALANSGGQWTFVLGLLTYGFVHSSGGSFRNWAIPLTLATDAGLVLGGTIAQQRPSISRGQTLALDAGALLGGLAGGAGGVMISGHVDTRTTYALAAVGLLAGLGTAGYLTRDWGIEDARVSTVVTPAPGGAVASALFSW